MSRVLTGTSGCMNLACVLDASGINRTRQSGMFYGYGLWQGGQMFVVASFSCHICLFTSLLDPRVR